MTDDTPQVEPDQAARELYAQLLNAWNKRNARDYALLFTSDGSMVGFDGSQVNGQLEIGAHVTEIFTHHQTPHYIGIVRDVRVLAGDVTLLRANAGMVPADKTEIDPALNAVQSVVCVRKTATWKIAHFQNTPAAFHQRPDLAKQLTEELRGRLKENSPAR